MTPTLLLQRYLQGDSLSKLELRQLLDACLLELNDKLRTLRELKEGRLVIS